MIVATRLGHVACALLLSATFVAGQSSSSTSAGMSTDQVMSPVVVGAWFAHHDAAGALLDLLVLFRGSAGWWQSGSGGGSAGGSGSKTSMTLHRGKQQFDVRLPDPRVQAMMDIVCAQMTGR
jgi:hypothetical protein